MLPQILAQGWVLVATGYPGMGTKGPSPFLIGQGEARSDLDAVRAAHQLSGRLPPGSIHVAVLEVHLHDAAAAAHGDD